MTDTRAVGSLAPVTAAGGVRGDRARWHKRLFDLILASLMLTLAAPLLLLLAIAIKLSSRGPVFHSQQRIGLDGRPFGMLKLRTMRRGSDDQPHRAYARAWIEQNVDFDGAGNFKITDDPRVFGVGRWLRRFSLDELPQLINVVRGEMSLVGPRPALPYELDCYRPHHRRRLAAMPGITGLWQVSGRHRLSFEEMVALDVEYQERWSLGLDVAILGRTVGVVLLEPGY